MAILGTYTPPPDKSISHRLVFFSSIAEGKTVIENLLEAEDVFSTIKMMRMCGVKIEKNSNWEITGTELTEPLDVIDAGNSGTTARIGMGLLASYEFFSVITGDDSLKRRPMRRVVEPLNRMGAFIIGRENGNRLPIAIKGAKLHGIDYELPVASAQVKSCVILAALRAISKTVIKEPRICRDHTERLLPYFGANLKKEGSVIIIEPSRLKSPQWVRVPGDISAAVYFVVAALIFPGSHLIIRDVGLNPTRAKYLEILKRSGAPVFWEVETEYLGEPCGKIEVNYGEVKDIEIFPEEVPAVIDDIPALAVLAAAKGVSFRVSGAEELRLKESDRLKAVSDNLRRLGINVLETKDGISFYGKPLSPAKLEGFGDHRIVMAFSILERFVPGIEIIDKDWVKISYPNFFADFDALWRY